MLLAMHIAHLEYHERIRDFNVRAARGEFIRYADDQLESAGQVRWSERLGRAIRQRFGRQRGRRLVAQPGVDSV